MSSPRPTLKETLQLLTTELKKTRFKFTIFYSEKHVFDAIRVYGDINLQAYVPNNLNGWEIIFQDIDTLENVEYEATADG
jgi:hypothetical protein